MILLAQATPALTHAANAAVKANVVQTSSGGGDLTRVLLRCVSLCEDIFLAELGVVIKVHLGIANQN